jgi:hypothetical protein
MLNQVELKKPIRIVVHGFMTCRLKIGVSISSIGEDAPLAYISQWRRSGEGGRG